MSLRLRLTILYSALTGGILLIFGVLLYSLVNILLVTQVDTTLFQTANDLLLGWRVGPAGELSQETLPKLNLTSFVYYQIWDNNGRLHSSSPGLGQINQPFDPIGYQLKSSIYRNSLIQKVHLRVLNVPLEAGGRPIGTLQVAASMTMVDTTRQSLVQTIIVIAVAAILFAAALSWFFIGQALSPLVDITESALRISGADDLSQRIPQRPVREPGLRRGPPGRAPGRCENDEMGRLVTAFNDTLGRLEQLFTSQQRFLADVSHELRTPLTVIKGNVDLMRRMKQVDEESLDNIEDEADRLTRLVGDLLLEAQAESGKLPLHFAPVELDTLLLEVFKEMRILARERVQLKLPEIDQIVINGDRDRLKQVLINLIANAIKYTPQGGEVVLSLGKVADNARLIVRDTGLGIPAEDLPHIFERFYRAEKSRSRSKAPSGNRDYLVGGFGLGLSIAYWIVNHHGGQIEVDSTEGKGTTFCIYLPMPRAGTGTTTPRAGTGTTMPRAGTGRTGTTTPRAGTGTTTPRAGTGTTTEATTKD
ncbi:MAG: ATP-binding protein [Chloroflexi bacterium]|nr:ATP-binding protein [Chloroflexota bacterium]